MGFEQKGMQDRKDRKDELASNKDRSARGAALFPGNHFLSLVLLPPVLSVVL